MKRILTPFLVIYATLLRDGKKDNFSNNKNSGNPPCKCLFGKNLWRRGLSNVALIKKGLRQSHPALKDIRYDAARDNFRYVGNPVTVRIEDGEGGSFNRQLTPGNPIPRGGIRGLVGLSRTEGLGAENGIGETTIKRAAVTRSTLEAYQGRESLGLLADGFSGRGVSLVGTLYSKLTNNAIKLETIVREGNKGNVERHWGVFHNGKLIGEYRSEARAQQPFKRSSD